jgi:hypothetical protein
VKCILDPAIVIATFLGTMALVWASFIHMSLRSSAVNGGFSAKKKRTFCLVSIGASIGCILLFAQVPDWRLIWIRWNRLDFCALPGHSALREPFILAAVFAFLSPQFAYLGFRLADRMVLKITSLFLLLLGAFIVGLVIQGLFWPTDWR